jgi:hypothetical protein
MSSSGFIDVENKDKRDTRSAKKMNLKMKTKTME